MDGVIRHILPAKCPALLYRKCYGVCECVIVWVTKSRIFVHCSNYVALQKALWSQCWIFTLFWTVSLQNGHFTSWQQISDMHPVQQHRVPDADRFLFPQVHSTFPQEIPKFSHWERIFQHCHRNFGYSLALCIFSCVCGKNSIQFALRSAINKKYNLSQYECRILEKENLGIILNKIMHWSCRVYDRRGTIKLKPYFISNDGKNLWEQAWLSFTTK